MIKQQIFPLSICPFGTKVEIEVGEKVDLGMPPYKVIWADGKLYSEDLESAVRFLNRQGFEVVQIMLQGEFRNYYKLLVTKL